MAYQLEEINRKLRTDPTACTRRGWNLPPTASWSG